MIANSNVELLENAIVKLTITVDKKSIQEDYDELLRQYSKSIQLKGFRKGKVPAEILIRKFGPSLIGEIAERIIHKSLDEALEAIDQKLKPNSKPKVDSEKPIELGNDFTYQVSYETYPIVELCEYRGLEYEKIQVKISKNDEELELKTLQEQNALFVDKEGGRVEKGNVVNIDYLELDAGGKEVQDSRRESFIFEVGTGNNIYKIDEEIVGMKKDEEREIKKSFPEDFEYREAAGREVTLKVKLNSIKEKQLPEVNDELAQDISDKYHSLEDLKKDISQKLEDFRARKIREKSISQLLDKIVENSKIELPKSMVDNDLSQRWKNFEARFSSDKKKLNQALAEQGKTREEILEGWRPDSERRLKLQLAVATMVEKEQIQISDEEVDQKILKEAETRNMSFEELKSQMTQKNLLELLKTELKNEKLYDLLLESATSKKGMEINFLDLARGNY